jgi:membrane protein YdbS with pleckstrin-like domain
MFTEKEKQFIEYWQKNREAESRFSSKLLKGLPMALMFALPIILLVIVVRLFLPEWYVKISQTSPGMFATAIFAVVAVALFYSFFRMHYKWEMNEQLYQELKSKENIHTNT